MSKATALLILFACAWLEACGDRLMRKGMETRQWIWYVAAAAMLVAYGWLVNRPPWRFSELLGVYVVFFFAVSQFLAWRGGEKLTSPIYIGGALIVAGGIVIARGAGTV